MSSGMRNVIYTNAACRLARQEQLSVKPFAWLVLQCHKQLWRRMACKAVVAALQNDSEPHAEGRYHANTASVQPRSVPRGASCCLQFGDMRGFWGVWHAGLSQLRKKTGVISTAEGEGTANTALVYHANKLMSLHEGDLPYAVSHLYQPSTLEPVIQSICRGYGNLSLDASHSKQSLCSLSVYHANNPMPLDKGSLPNAARKALLWVVIGLHGAHECALLAGRATSCRLPASFA